MAHQRRAPRRGETSNHPDQRGHTGDRARDESVREVHATRPERPETPIELRARSAHRGRRACVDRKDRDRPHTGRNPRWRDGPSQTTLHRGWGQATTTRRIHGRNTHVGSGDKADANRWQRARRAKFVLHEPDPPSARRVNRGNAISRCSHFSGGHLREWHHNNQ